MKQESDDSSDDSSEDQNGIAEKIDAIHNYQKKSVKNLTEQIDNINKDLGDMNNKIININ